MAHLAEVRLPDLGDVQDVEVVEILVAPGQRVEKGQALLVLESEKASTEIPAPYAGTIKEIKVEVGSKVAEGTVICTMETSEEAAGPPAQAKPAPGKEKNPVAAPELATPGPASPGRPAPKPATGLTLVLGGGPGGYEAAIRLGQLGQKVMLVERSRVGGVCLHSGCIPSKALIDTAHRVHAVKELSGRGVALQGGITIDLKMLQRWKREMVERLAGFIEGACRKVGVELVRGEGRLASPNKVVIESDEGRREVEFERCILAVGSRAVELGALPFDGKTVLSARHALDLEELPARLLVVGGGYIGLELGIAYRKLGSQVALVEMEDQILPGADPALVRPLSRRLKELGVEAHLGAKLVSFAGGKAKVAGKKGESQIEASHVLVAVGRRPNTDRIALEAAGLAPDDRGYLSTNEHKQTTLEHIFAVGDITHGPALAHKAAAEGHVAAEVIAGLPAAFDHRAVPAVVFTDPELSYVGLSETQARGQGYEPKSVIVPNRGLGRALIAGETEGMAKLVYDGPSGLLLGAQLAGGPATDMIGGLGLALEMGTSIEDLALTIFPHPTFSEQVMVAAQRIVHEEK